MPESRLPRLAALVLALALAIALALFFSSHGRIVRAPDLTDIEGRPLVLPSLPGDDPAVILFIATDCPIANSYAPEISRLAREYASRADFILAHVDPELSDDAARAHASEYALESSTLVVDRRHLLVAATGVSTTPEAVVLTSEGKIAYRGRINDLYAAFGDKRAAASEHNLRDALDATLAGQPVPTPRTETIGCLIEPLD